MFLTVSRHTNPPGDRFLSVQSVGSSRKWNLPIAAACVRSLSLLSCRGKALLKRSGAEVEVIVQDLYHLLSSHLSVPE